MKRFYLQGKDIYNINKSVFIFIASQVFLLFLVIFFFFGKVPFFDDGIIGHLALIYRLLIGAAVLIVGSHFINILFLKYNYKKYRGIIGCKDGNVNLKNRNQSKGLKILLILFQIFTLIFVFVVFFEERGVGFYNIPFEYIVLPIIFIVLLRQATYLFITAWFEAVYFLRQNRVDYGEYNPLVSIIIPAWNEEKNIINTIQSVLESSYEKLEIVVVNDGSTDNSDKLIRDFVKFFEKVNCSDKKILYKFQNNTGKGGALNRGIKMSSGDLIMTLDADSILDQEAIKNVVRVFRDPEIMAASGRVKIGNINNFWGIVQYLEYLTSFVFKKSEDLLGTLYVIGGASGFFRREVFEKVGLFSDTNITEDVEMSLRIQEAGMKIVYIPDAVVITEGAASFNSLLKQRIRWRQGRYQAFLSIGRDLLFSTKRKHNKILSWIALPYAIFLDILLLIEPIFLVMLALKSFYTHNFLSFVIFIFATSMMAMVVVVNTHIQDKSKKMFFQYMLIAWLVYYAALLVEFLSNIKVLYNFFSKSNEKWQKWKRVGLGLEQKNFTVNKNIDIHNKKSIYRTKWKFIVHNHRSKIFKQKILKWIEILEKEFYICKIILKHRHIRKFNIKYCQYELEILFKDKDALTIFRQKFEKLLSSLMWLSSDYSVCGSHFIKSDNAWSKKCYDKKNICKERCSLCQMITKTARKKHIKVTKSRTNHLKTMFFSWLFFVLLMFALFFFYWSFYTSTQSINTIFIIILMIISTDGVMLAVNLFRSKKKNEHKNVQFNPSLVTCVIACYNGEDVIGETLRQAMFHLPKNQIIVVSDKSTDNTAEVARKMGVQVIENKINMNKALSISNAVVKVKTPLVLIMDDDVYIKNVFIPTSLITEDGYRAVAFNVLPKKTGKLINYFQLFEYHKSMFFGKKLRSRVGAISNVSGAIGLFRREDIDLQKTIHSGQFGGEDQQRTMFAQLYSLENSQKDKGVTFYDSTVITDVPDSLKAFLKQRSFGWGMATHETFFPSLRIIFSKKTHFLLKLDRTYLIFIFLTEPIRMALFPLLFFHLDILLILTGGYFVLENMAWFRLRKKIPYWVVVMMPFFNILKIGTRFVAYFYWIKVKWIYIKKEVHKNIVSRNLMLEYLTVVLLMLVSISMVLLSLWHKYYRY